MKRLSRKVLAALTASVCVLILGGCGQTSTAQGPPQMPPPEVEVAPVAQEDVEVRAEWVATIDGSVNAQIQPQVMGYLVKQNYQEGAYVRKGQALFEIDPRPFQALVDQARGQLAQAESQVILAQSQVAQAESQVAQSEAQLVKAELDVKRDTPLVTARAIPQSQLDTETQARVAADAGVKASRSNVLASQATVKTAQAAVQSAKASLDQAELNLGFTKVRSLIDGIAGIAQTQIGNLVKTDSVLTTVSQLNPVRVYFPISEQEYLAISAKSGRANADNLLYNPKAPLLDLILTNGETYGQKGKVIFADRQVDPQTGTIRIAAAFDNPGNVLRPGQFARIRTIIGRKPGALLIPQRAVTELQGNHHVAVVGSDNKVKIRSVKLGQVVGSRYVINEGLQAGERVIVEGLAKAQDGSPVVPKTATAANVTTEGQ
jgi:RND family efflux transporter MFP subunit